MDTAFQYQPPVSVRQAQGLDAESLKRARQQGLLPANVKLPENFSNQVVSKSFWTEGSTYTPINFTQADGQLVSYYLTNNGDRRVPGDVFRGENEDFHYDKTYQRLEGINPAIKEYEKDSDYLRTELPFEKRKTHKESFVSREQVLKAKGLTQHERDLDASLRKLGEHGGLFITQSAFKERMQRDEFFGQQWNGTYFFTAVEQNVSHTLKNRDLYLDARGFSGEGKAYLTEEAPKKVSLKKDKVEHDSTKNCLWRHKEPMLPPLEPRLGTMDYQVRNSGIDGFELTRVTGESFYFY